MKKEIIMEEMKKNKGAGAEASPAEEVLKGQGNQPMTMTPLSQLNDEPADLLGKLLYNHSQFVGRCGFDAKDPDGEIALAMKKFVKVCNSDLWHRGFHLLGNPGTGKFSVLKAIQMTIVKDADCYGRNDGNEPLGGFWYMSARNMVYPYADIRMFNSAAEMGTLVIDDIGMERGIGENLTLAQSLIGELIKRRYDAGLFTIIGSVFDAQNLGEVYGSNIEDIIKESYVTAELSHNFRRDIIIENQNIVWDET